MIGHARLPRRVTRLPAVRDRSLAVVCPAELSIDAVRDDAYSPPDDDQDVPG
jgi:hypothetical protein